MLRAGMQWGSRSPQPRVERLASVRAVERALQEDGIEPWAVHAESDHRAEGLALCNGHVVHFVSTQVFAAAVARLASPRRFVLWAAEPARPRHLGVCAPHACIVLREMSARVLGPPRSGRRRWELVDAHDAVYRRRVDLRDALSPEDRACRLARALHDVYRAYRKLALLTAIRI